MCQVSVFDSATGAMLLRLRLLLKSTLDCHAIQHNTFSTCKSATRAVGTDMPCRSSCQGGGGAVSAFPVSESPAALPKTKLAAAINAQAAAAGDGSGSRRCKALQHALARRRGSVVAAGCPAALPVNARDGASVLSDQATGTAQRHRSDRLTPPLAS